MIICTSILAGGRSRRMGRDKAALRIDNQTLLERTARLAQIIAPPIFIIGRAQPTDWPSDLTATFLLDPISDRGPLAGLATALEAAAPHGGDTLLLSCDLPRLNEQALRWLIEQAHRNRAAHGVIACSGENWEPLFSVYRSDVAALVAARLSRNQTSMRGLIDEGEFDFAPIPIQIAPALFNLNTSEDWRRLEEEMRAGT